MDTKQNNGNTGEHNIGFNNSGDYNTGNRNSGAFNSGDWNSGNGNTGSWNTGNRNIGHSNTGNFNIGDGNTGDFNLANNSYGCFNTITPTISFFDQPADWTLSDWQFSEAHEVLSDISTSPLVWISEKDMSETEKKEHPDYKTQNGYLKELSYEEAMAWKIKKWKALSDHDKFAVMSLPNFDKEIFREITGIDVDND